MENKKKEKEEEIKNNTNNYTLICPALNEAVQNSAQFVVNEHKSVCQPRPITTTTPMWTSFLLMKGK